MKFSIAKRKKITNLFAKTEFASFTDLLSNRAKSLNIFAQTKMQNSYYIPIKSWETSIQSTIHYFPPSRSNRSAAHYTPQPKNTKKEFRHFTQHFRHKKIKNSFEKPVIVLKLIPIIFFRFTDLCGEQTSYIYFPVWLCSLYRWCIRYDRGIGRSQL